MKRCGAGGSEGGCLVHDGLQRALQVERGGNAQQNVVRCCRLRHAAVVPPLQLDLVRLNPGHAGTRSNVRPSSANSQSFMRRPSAPSAREAYSPGVPSLRMMRWQGTIKLTGLVAMTEAAA